MRTLTVALASALLALPLTLQPLLAQPSPESCKALADLRLEDTNLLSATVVPASDALPEYCRVLGYVRPAINFEIRLPTSGWNGKFYMAGCGGLCGKVESENPRFANAINYGLKRNYAVSTTDTGHWGETPLDGRWAYQNPVAEVDFAYRAAHETARVTKATIEAFYGQAPEKSYFQGCSNGGRMAHVAASRYPEDFDGIISGAPNLDTAGWIAYMSWIAQANTGPDGKNLITPDEIGLVATSVYEACDGLDGLEDGLISDPSACQFDPATLACKGDKRADCLSAEQVEALRALYEGPKDASGEPLYPGVPFGSEPYWGFLIGETEEAYDDPGVLLATDVLRYLAFQEDPGARYSILDFDPEKDLPRAEHAVRLGDVPTPELEAFRERGGKVLMWHSWADAAIPPAASVAYHEALEDSLGRQKAAEFLRLFLVPGMEHCGFAEGPGITDAGFDPLTALEQWVEEGEPPANLLATKTDSTGQVLWTRPLCPYPKRAVYKGQGNIKEASSFECVDPSSNK